MRLIDTCENKFNDIEVTFDKCRDSRQMIFDELSQENKKISSQWQYHMERLHQHVLADDEVSDIHPVIESRFDKLKIDLEDKIKKATKENEKLALRLEEMIISQPETRLRSFSDECRNTENHRRFDDGNMSNNEEDSEDIVSVSAKISTFSKSLGDLETRIAEYDTRILECEQYSRRECVIISGIPATVKDHKLESTVIDILKKLDITISDSDISAIHRLGVTTNPRYPARVIVKFVNRKIANLCFERRDWLYDLHGPLKMNIRFYESLAQLNQEALRLCQWLFENGHIYDYFLRNGFSKIVVAENSKPLKVPHP